MTYWQSKIIYLGLIRTINLALKLSCEANARTTGRRVRGQLVINTTHQVRQSVAIGKSKAVARQSLNGAVRRQAVTNTILVTQIRARGDRSVTKTNTENKNRPNNQGDSHFSRQIQRAEKRGASLN